MVHPTVRAIAIDFSLFNDLFCIDPAFWLDIEVVPFSSLKSLDGQWRSLFQTRLSWNLTGVGRL